MLIFQIIIMVMHDREIFRQWYEAAVLSRLNNRRPSESWRAPSAYKQITCLSTHAYKQQNLGKVHRIWIYIPEWDKHLRTVHMSAE